jgi:hypothetical protein
VKPKFWLRLFHQGVERQMTLSGNLGFVPLDRCCDFSPVPETPEWLRSPTERPAAEFLLRVPVSASLPRSMIWI